MKKLIIAITVMLFGFSAFAQNTNNLNKAKKGLISWLFGTKNDDLLDKLSESIGKENIKIDYNIGHT